MSVITVVTDFTGEWEALYVDDLLKEEGHSISLTHAMEALKGVTVSAVQRKECDFEAHSFGKAHPFLSIYKQHELF